MTEKLQEIRGVGAVTARKLHDAGLTEVDHVAEATIELLIELTGFYAARAEAVRRAADELRSLHSPPAEAELAIEVSDGEPPDPVKVVESGESAGVEKRERRRERKKDKTSKKGKKAKKAGKKAKAKKEAKRAKKRQKALQKKLAKIEARLKKARKAGKKKKAKKLKKKLKALRKSAGK